MSFDMFPPFKSTGGEFFFLYFEKLPKKALTKTETNISTKKKKLFQLTHETFLTGSSNYSKIASAQK